MRYSESPIFKSTLYTRFWNNPFNLSWQSHSFQGKSSMLYIKQNIINFWWHIIIWNSSVPTLHPPLYICMHAKLCSSKLDISDQKEMKKFCFCSLHFAPTSNSKTTHTLKNATNIKVNKLISIEANSSWSYESFICFLFTKQFLDLIWLLSSFCWVEYLPLSSPSPQRGFKLGSPRPQPTRNKWRIWPLGYGTWLLLLVNGHLIITPRLR